MIWYFSHLYNSGPRTVLNDVRNFYYFILNIIITGIPMICKHTSILSLKYYIN